MSQATVRTIFDLVQSVAPFESQEDFDNSGLLIGTWDAKVDTVLSTLDPTLDVVREAKNLGAQLILSHHPLFFHGRNNLVENEPEAIVICEIVRNHMNLVSAHTNLDKSPLSGSMCIAKALNLEDIRTAGFLVDGSLAEPVTARDLSKLIAAAIHAPIRLYGAPDRIIQTLAVACGAYGEGYHEAMNLHADAFVTGEIKHHEVLDAVQRGLIVYEAGHYATEAILIPNLCTYLQNALDAVQYQVRVCPSTCVSYMGALE